MCKNVVLDILVLIKQGFVATLFAMFKIAFSKVNSNRNMCKSNRIKGIDFCIVGTYFRKEFTSSERLFLRFIQF